MASLVVYEAISVEKVLARLAEKILQTAQRVVLFTSTPERALFFDQLLWTYTPLSFLPHGCQGQDSTPEDHPLWITTHLENPNGASILLLVEGPLTQEAETFFQRTFEKVLLLISLQERLQKRDWISRFCADFASVTSWQQTKKGWIPL